MTPKTKQTIINVLIYALAVASIIMWAVLVYSIIRWVSFIKILIP